MPRSEVLTQDTIDNELAAKEDGALRRAGRKLWDNPDSAVANLLRILELEQSYLPTLINFLEDLCRWYGRIETLEFLPSIRGYQPTRGEIQETLKPFIKQAEKLVDVFNAIPSELLEDFRVKLQCVDGEVESSIGTIIEALTSSVHKVRVCYTKTSDDLKVADMRGNLTRNRTAAINIGTELYLFAKEMQPQCSDAQLSEFIFRALDVLKIKHPDPRSKKKPTEALEFLRAVHAFSSNKT